MTNPLYTSEQLPSTSLAAIREFDERYLAYVGASQPSDIDKLGDLVPTDAPLVTFPVSQLRTKYQRTEGESKTKTLQEKSFDVKVEEFDDGYEASLMDLFKKVFAYRKWQEAPARLVLAEATHRAKSIAALLEDGLNQDCVDGVKFFSATHPANLHDSGAGTWSNYQASTKDVVSIANIAAEVTLMKGVKDENGDKFGVNPDTILVPTEKVEALRNLLAQALILNAGTSTTDTSTTVSNPYMGGRFNVVECKELTDVNDWFLIDSKLLSQGCAPWLSMRMSVPSSLALRVYDESSDFFRNTGRIKMSSHIWYGFALAMPHGIRLIKGA